MKDWHTIDGYFEDVDQKDYDSLVWQIPHGGKMVEVGCYRGKSLGSIAQTIIDKDISVLAVDIFDIIYMPGYDAMPTLERSFDDFRDNIAESGLSKNVKTLIQTRVGAARHEMGLGSKFDLIFLDADHSYKGIREDIESWWPLLKYGGILCGHDYRDDVEKYVKERFPIHTPMTSSIWYVIK